MFPFQADAVSGSVGVASDEAADDAGLDVDGEAPWKRRTAGRCRKVDVVRRRLEQRLEKTETTVPRSVAVAQPKQTQLCYDRRR